MDILFNSDKDRELANSQQKLEKKYQGNPNRIKLIRSRLDLLRDISNLAMIRNFPQANCHELKGNRKGQFAVKLDKGYRLIFESANNPIPQKSDGGLDWNKITAIKILSLAEDYHD
ncbi:MAG: killer suppression protein [Candidatus Schekmanbacteria bacterium]|nr:killer suppression protein [Candidatus Schekmanbacteria bacterium]